MQRNGPTLPNQGGNWRRNLGTVVKPKHFKGTLKRLWELTKGQRQGIGLVLLLACFAAGTVMTTPYLIGKVVDSVASGYPSRVLLGVLAAFYIGDYFIKFIQAYTMAGVSQRMVKYMRKVLFGHFNQLPIAFFDKRQHGDLMSRLTNDIDNISTTISDSLTHLIQLVFTILGVFLVMITLNVTLTGVTLVAGPLIYGLTKIITKRTRVLFKQQQQVLGKLNGQIEESISGTMIVKAYGREEMLIEEFEAVNEQLRSVATKAQIWSGFLMPLMNVINNISFIFIAVVGGFLATQNSITVGMISSFLLYARQFTRPLNDVANIYNVLQTAVAGAERIFEILDEEVEIVDCEGAKELIHPKGAITFENVYFGYEVDQPILKSINLEIEAGTRVAIVGSTGAGKTTIISLLTRFYDVNAGRILLDGEDIRRYRRKDLRQCFGVVLQDTALFPISILENIRYGKIEATDEEVITAAKRANAHSFIKRLPQGYETLIGSEANGLSQGEKQLITIARAILTNAPIMILDEATSSVDTRTEHKIKEAIQTLTAGRTSIFIAHRLSTIRDCYIIVLEKGEIAEQGNHEELIKQQGIYYQMYQTQIGA